MDYPIDISLNGEWTMRLMHHKDYLKLDREPTLYDDIALTNPISATVPGNFELDMQNAGLIDDPFLGLNPIDMQLFEDMHVFYARKFAYKAKPGIAPELVFEGIDTVAQIYLNGELIGSADNMFIRHVFKADGMIDGENELVVHILPACIAARSFPISAGHAALKYNFETIRLRKAAHMFGWDIMPRLVSAGLFRPVGIRNRPQSTFEQLYLYTTSVDPARNRATIELFFDIDIGHELMSDYAIKIEGGCGKSKFKVEQRCWFTAGKLEIDIDDAELWWPKGYGEPNLYDIKVSLLKKGRTADVRTFRLGIRTVNLIRTSTTDVMMSGDFHFEVNGRRVFIMGTNWVPVDAYHSRDAERIPRIMELVRDIGVNGIRVWGGGVYEDLSFYDACDEMGILVWQDFMMACGVYPIDPEFMAVMREESTAAIRQLRQHPCVMLWSGDNECDQFIRYGGAGDDPNKNKITRELLKDVVFTEDPTRPYLPSSPYMDDEAMKLPDAFLTENHLWGPRDYFKGSFYKDSLCNFASEMGYHGCPSVESIEKFISKDKLWSWQHNDEWLAHAASADLTMGGTYNYRIELMAKQIKELFGAVPNDLQQFSLASQISQAEAKKFFVEMFRLGQPKRSGLMWWNLIDGWPQFSDAVVDYYFDKKLAYDYLKQSQQGLLLSFKEPSNWQLKLCAVNNSGADQSFDYCVKDYQTGEIMLQGKGCCSDQSVFELGELPYSHGEKRLYLIEWTGGRNHYLAGNPPFDLQWYAQFLKDYYGWTAH